MPSKNNEPKKPLTSAELYYGNLIHISFPLRELPCQLSLDNPTIDTPVYPVSGNAFRCEVK